MEKNFTNAKVAFLYCLSMIVLGFLASGVGTALFGLIDKLLPEISAGYYAGLNGGAFKYAISSIIIAGPLYYWLVYLLRKGLINNEYSNDSGPRRWLTYLLLLVSSVTIIGSLVRLLYSFLDGDLSLRFGLKALIVVIIAGLIFGYYFYDLKKEIKAKDVFVRIIFVISLLLVVASFVLSVVYGESPKVARSRKVDQQTISLLDRVESSVNMYYQRNKKLPVDMNELTENSDGMIMKSDFDGKTSDVKIDYMVENNEAYKLCANFEIGSDEQNIDNDYLGRRWQHNQGYKCFLKRVDKVVNEKNLDLID